MASNSKIENQIKFPNKNKSTARANVTSIQMIKDAIMPPIPSSMLRSQGESGLQPLRRSGEGLKVSVILPRSSFNLNPL